MIRLLKARGNGHFDLIEFTDDKIPCYAILSHTWGQAGEEVTFKDILESTARSKTGFTKIKFCGEQAARHGLEYFWVDTCCIDKSSSAELGEAINSMFRWYKNATRCYVYLSDVSVGDGYPNGHYSSLTWESAFRASRWFTRGWTLQELLAPASIEFFSLEGRPLGDKSALKQQLHEITGIAIPALQGTTLSAFSVEERMLWVEGRETHRPEDMAYSLLGIFEVCMLPIYSEGAENAFRRLREELDKRPMKRQLDEVSNVSHATFNSTKRSRTSYNQSSSIPLSRESNCLDPEPILYSEHSMHDDDLPETPNEPVTKVSHTIDADIKQALIVQLYFTKIDERLTSLTAARGTTCRWFLTSSKYKSWHDKAQQLDHGGFLWIKGNPGTGKSTLMKLLFEKTKLSARNDPAQITLSFFFLARGTVEERSTTGLYRSLLHQLFEKMVDLKDSIEWMTLDGARVIQRNGWHEEALKQTLKHAIEKLGSRSLTIFVDALDECDKTQAASLICFFEELCDHGREAQVRLQICFSSRHYPTVVIQRGIQVTLEHEKGHTEDIEQYIRSRLRLGNSKQAETIRVDILKKSSKIFLWVVLVLDILNSEFPDSSISIKKIRERLKDIPPELTSLFEMILTRDGENLERLQICLKWILFATRPLKPQELYFAVYLGLEKECSGYWDQEDVDLDQIKTFVRSASKGLAEVTRNKASEVQFIHESVRDFLLGKYEGQWSGASGNFVGHSHEILGHCCLAQLNARISQNIHIPDPLPEAPIAAELRETIKLKFPFLEYSVLHILRHSNIAQQNAIGQGDFLANFPLQQWIFLNNTLEKFNVRRYTKSASLLYILAEKNLADLIRIHPKRESCFEIENERYGLPVFAALATGSDEAIRTLLEVLVESQPLMSPLHGLWKQYCRSEYKWGHFGRDFTFSRKRSIDSYLEGRGDEIVIACYLINGVKPDSKDLDCRTLLSRAARKGHEVLVKLLLATEGVDADSRDDSGRTPLTWAAYLGHEAVVKLLLATEGVDANSRDDSGRTPLSWAAYLGYEAIVKLLLATEGVDADSRDDRGRTPLSWAAYLGYEAIVKLLLATEGVDADSRDDSGQTPLSWAAGIGYEAIVKLLLATDGVDADSRDISGQTPLSYAAGNGHEAIVKLLLATEGVDANLRDNSRQTPLTWAAYNRHEAIVKLLLAKEGVDANSRDDSGRTPLSWAAYLGYEAIVKLLLATDGVDADSRDISGQTPLSYAAGNGHEAIVKLLLATEGVDANLRDNSRQTPLTWAAYNRHEAIVKLLLATEGVTAPDPTYIRRSYLAPMHPVAN